MSASEQFNNSGFLRASNLRVTGKEFSNSGQLEAERLGVTVNRYSAQNGGSLAAEGQLDFYAAQSYHGGNSLIQGQDVTIEGASWDQDGGVFLAKRNAVFFVDRVGITNGAQWQILGDLSVKSVTANLTDSVLRTGGTLRWTTSEWTLDKGSVTASQDITLIGKTMGNSGIVGSSKGLRMTSQVFNNQGSVRASENMALGIDEGLVNEGLIQSEKELIIEGEGQFTNENGTVLADTLVIKNKGLITTKGSVLSGISWIDINAPVSNAGLIQSDGAILLSGSTITNSGTLFGNGPLTLNGNAMDNTGKIESDKEVFITSTAFTNQSTGELKSGLHFLLQSSLFNLGRIESKAGLTLDSRNGEILNGATGVLKSGASHQIFSKTLINDGIVGSGGASGTTSNLFIQAEEVTNNGIFHADSTFATTTTTFTNSGRLEGESLVMNGNLRNMKDGVLASGTYASLFGHTLQNEGTIQAVTGATLSANVVINDVTGTVFSEGTATITNLTNNGNVHAGSALILTKNLTNNSTGKLEGIEGIGINVETFYNAGAIRVAAQDKDLRIVADKLTQEHGTLVSAGHIGLTAATMDLAGSIAASGNIRVDVLSRLTTRGVLHSEREFSVFGEGVFTNDGGVVMGDSVLLRNNGFVNINNGLLRGVSGIDISAPITNAADIRSDGAIVLSGLVTNSGTIFGNGPLTLNGNFIENSGTLDSASEMAITSVVLTNQSTGVLKSGANITLKSALINKGAINAVWGLTVDAGNGDILNDSTGAIKVGASQILLSKTFTNNGVMASSGAPGVPSSITIQADTITNTGFMHADSDLSTTATTLTNSGRLEGGSLLMRGNLVNQEGGSLVSATQAMLVGSSVRNSGAIQSALNLTVSGNVVTNEAKGTIQSSGSLARIKNLTNSGGISVDGTLVLTGDLTNNSDGRLVAREGIQINTGALSNNGRIQVTGIDKHLSISATSITQGSGVLLSAGTIGMTATTADFLGSIVASGNIGIGINTALTNRGVMSAGKDWAIYGEGIFTNDGGTLVADSVVFRNNGLQNKTGSVVRGVTAVDINAPVNNAGAIQSIGLILLTGSVLNSGQVAASGNLYLNGNLTNVSGAQFISDNGIFLTSKAITNGGVMSSGKDLTLTSDTFINQSGGILQSGRDSLIKTTVTNSGVIRSVGNMALIGNYGGTVGSKLLTDGQLTLTGSSIENTGGTVSSGKELFVTAGSFTNQSYGTVTAGTDAQINANVLNHFKISAVGNVMLLGDYTSSAGTGLYAGNNLSMTSKTINNNGNLEVSTLVVSANNLANNSYGVLHSKNDMYLKGIVSNYGQITATGNLVLNGDLSNYSGSGLITDRVLNLSGKNITNAGSIQSGASTTLTSTTFTNQGTLLAGTDATFLASLTNSGKIQAKQGLTVTALNGSVVTETGSEIKAGASQVYSVETFINRGKIASGGAPAVPSNLTVLAGTMTNTGGIQADSDLVLTIRGNLINDRGTIWGGTSTIQAATLSNINAGGIDGYTFVNINAAVTNAGSIISNGAIAISGSQLINDKGTLGSAGTLQLAITGAASNKAGRMIASQNVQISAQTIDNTGGLISAGGNGIFTTTTLTNADTKPDNLGIRTNGILQFTGSVLNNSNGFIQSGENLSLTAPQINNANGYIRSNSTMGITASTLFNNEGGTLSSNGLTGLTINEFRNDNNGLILQTNKDGHLSMLIDTLNNGNGAILSKGSVGMSIKSNQLTGTIAASSNVAIGASSLTNQAKIFAGGDLAFYLDGTLTNDGGIGHSDSNLIIRANILSNKTGSTLYGRNGIDISATLVNAGTIGTDHGNMTILGSTIDNSGDIEANGHIVLQASGAITNAKTIRSDSSLTVASNTLTNSGSGVIKSTGELFLTTALTNSGEINAHGKLTLIGNVSNTNGAKLQTDGDLLMRGASFENTGGTVSTDKDLSINATSFVNQSYGTVKVGRNAEINANFLNHFVVEAVGNLSLFGNYNASAGTKLSAGNALSVSGETVNNNGDLNAGSTLDISATNIVNNGTLQSQGNGTYSGTFTNTGTAFSNSDMTITGPSITNSGMINARLNGTFTATGTFQNDSTGTVNVGASQTIRATNVVNNGSIKSGGAPAVPSNVYIFGTTLTNNGYIWADSQLGVEATTLTNMGKLTGGNISMLVNDNLTNLGDIKSVNDIGISGVINLEVLNKGGSIYSSDGSIRITAKTLINTVDAGPTASIAIGTVTERYKGFFSSETTRGSWDISLEDHPWTKQASISAGNAVEINTQSVQNIGSKIEGSYLRIQTADFVNKGYGDEIKYTPNGTSSAFSLENTGGNINNGNSIYSWYNNYYNYDKFNYQLSQSILGINDTGRHNAAAQIKGNYVLITATNVTNGDQDDKTQVATAYGYSLNGGNTTIDESHMLSLIKGNIVNINATNIENNGFIKTGTGAEDGIQLNAYNLTNNGAMDTQTVYGFMTGDVKNFGVIKGNNVALWGYTVDNEKTIQATDKLSVYATSSLVNGSPGKLKSANTTLFSNYSLTNYGAIEGTDKLYIKAPVIYGSISSSITGDQITIVSNSLQDYGTTTFGTLDLSVPNGQVVQGGTWTGQAVVGAVGDMTFGGKTQVDGLSLRVNQNLKNNGQIDAKFMQVSANGTIQNGGKINTDVALLSATKGIQNTNSLTATNYLSLKSSQDGFTNNGILNATNLRMDLAKTIDKKSMIGLTDPRFNKITDTQMQTIETLLGGRIVVKGISYKITNAGGTFALEESGTLAAKLWQSTPSLFKANIVLSDSTKLHFEEMKTLSNKDFAGQLLNELSADRKAVLIATLKGEAGNSLAIGEHAFSVEEKVQLLALLEGQGAMQTPGLDPSDREYLLKFIDPSISLLKGPAYLRLTDGATDRSGTIGLSGLKTNGEGVVLNAADFGLGDLGKTITFGRDGQLLIDGIQLGQVSISDSAIFKSLESLKTSELSDNWFNPNAVVGLDSRKNVDIDNDMIIKSLKARAGKNIKVSSVNISASDYISLEASENIDLAKGSSLLSKEIYADAGVDFNAIGAAIKGLQNIGIAAGHDVNILATTNVYTETTVERRGKKKITTETTWEEAVKPQIESGGEIVISAGNNTNLHGVEIKASGNVSIDAGNDVNISAIAETTEETVTTKKKGGVFGGGSTKTKTTEETTYEESKIATGGNIQIKAGNALTGTGVELVSGQDINLIGAGNVTITSVLESKNIEEKMKKKGFLSGKETEDIKHEETVNKALVSAAGNVSVKSVSGNIAMIGTELKTGDGGDIRLEASKNIVIGEMTENDYTYHYEKKTDMLSGLANAFKSLFTPKIENGKLIGPSISQTAVSNTNTLSNQNVVGSNIYAGGNVITKSGQDTIVMASSISGAGVEMKAGGNMSVISAEQLKEITTKHSELTNTFTASVGNAYVDTAMSAVRAVDEISQSLKAMNDSKHAENETAAAIQAAQAADHAVNAGYAIANLSKDSARGAASAGSYGFYASVSMDTTGIETNETTKTSTSKGSSIVARSGNLNVMAEKKMTVQGSELASAGDMTIGGKEGTSIIAAANTYKQTTESHEVNTHAELYNTTGIVDIPTAKMQDGSSKASGTTYQNSTIVSNGKLKVITNGDLTIDGGNVQGKVVDLTEVGGAVTILSKQNESQSKSHSEGKSVGGSVGFNTSEGESRRKWTDTASSIIGLEGVDIKAKSLNNTGAVIAQVNADGTTGTNLNIEVETMTNANLEDVDFAHNESKGLSINLNRTKEDGQTKAKTNFTTVGVQYSDGGHDMAKTDKATIGEGTVTVGGQTLGTDSTLNRDATKTQEMTRDRELGGTNVNLTLDVNIIAHPIESAEQVKEVVEVGGKLVGAAVLDATRKDNGIDIPMLATDKNGSVITDKNGMGVMVNSELENVLVSGTGADVGKYTERDKELDAEIDKNKTADLIVKNEGREMFRIPAPGEDHVLDATAVGNKIQAIPQNGLEVGGILVSATALGVGTAVVAGAAVPIVVVAGVSAAGYAIAGTSVSKTYLDYEEGDTTKRTAVVNIAGAIAPLFGGPLVSHALSNTSLVITKTNEILEQREFENQSAVRK